MRKYIFRRVLASLLTLFVVITLTFFMMRAIPGGPFTDEKAIPSFVLEKMMSRYGLNDPLYVQYGRYLLNVMRLDLGPSYRYEGMTVNELIAGSFPISAVVGSIALVLALIVGIPAGIISALKRGKLPDRFAMILLCRCCGIGVYLCVAFGLGYCRLLGGNIYGHSSGGNFSGVSCSIHL